MTNRKIAPSKVPTRKLNTSFEQKTGSDFFSRRKNERNVLMLDPLLLDKDGRALARIADISLDGALICSKGKPFPVGSRIIGWLNAPALGDFNEEFVAIWLTVSWCEQEGPEGWFKAGCIFDKGEHSDSVNLSSLIDTLKKPSKK